MADNNTPTITPPAVIPAPAPVVTIPTVPAVTPRQTVSAKKALGLDTTPRKALNAEVEKTAKTQPKDTLPYTPPVAPKPEEELVVEKPVETPVAKPAEPAKIETPAAPEKIKIGDKEYTREELEAALKEKNEPAPVAESKVESAPEKPAELTKEQVADLEGKWKAGFLQSSGASFAPSTEEMETLLSGGEDAVKLFASKQADVFASAVLHARKSIFEDLNKNFVPELESIKQALAPLMNQHQSLARYQIKSEFIKAHADLAPHAELSEKVAETLLQRYPQEIGQMNKDQFIAEVAKQTRSVLEVNAKSAGFASYKEQQEAVKLWKEKNAVAAAPGTVAPAVVPAPAAVKAPVANSPAAIASTPGASFAKSVAASLQG